MSSCRIEIDFFQLVHHRPLRAGRQILFERFHAARRSFSQRFDRTVFAVANIPDNLVSGRGALREEAIPDSLHFSTNEKLSRYLHLKRSPCLPFSSVNVSSSTSASFNVNVILSPFIDPT